MKIAIAALATLLASIDQSSGFVLPVHKTVTFEGLKTSIRAEPEAKKKVTASDIIARAQQAVGGKVDDIPPAPPVFEDETINDDIQAILLTLEKRVKEGPGSIGQLELTQLSANLKRVKDEMLEFESKPSVIDVNPPPPSPPPTPPSPTVDVTPPPPPPTPPSPPQAASQSMEFPDTFAVAKPDEQPAVKAEEEKKEYHEDNDEFGSPYDGKGGMGMARGTRNTYVIPGMEDMEPEEYRKALQKSVSDRQAKRRTEQLVGNRASHNYLESIGWGGASKALGRGKEA